MPYRVYKTKDGWIVKKRKGSRWITVSHHASQEKAHVAVKVRNAIEHGWRRK